MYRSLALSHLHGRSLMEDGAVSDDGNSESSDTNASKLSERDQAALSVFILITILGLMIYALRRLMRMIEAGLQKVRWRANVNNSFRSSNGYGTDWVIVVPVLLDSVAATAPSDINKCHLAIADAHDVQKPRLKSFSNPQKPHALFLVCCLAL